MVDIVLTPSEMVIAAQVGCMRQITNLRDGRQDAHGCQPIDGWRNHIEGAGGEMAVAKCLGVYWAGVGNLRSADVGKRLQVRTRSRHNYDLIVHKSDPDAPFVLVTGLMPRYIVRGWIMGDVAKRDGYWSDPAGGRPAFFVPQRALRPLSELEIRG